NPPFFRRLRASSRVGGFLSSHDTAAPASQEKGPSGAGGRPLNITNAHSFIWPASGNKNEANDRNQIPPTEVGNVRGRRIPPSRPRCITILGPANKKRGLFHEPGT